MRLLGRTTLVRDPIAGVPTDKMLYKAMQSISLTIAAGSSQIQRNIIGERILGLPKDR
jgi:alkylation response protein AidB-like acyl-CoA dehydrogenase